ncbi:WD40-repeat-containing domain protein [Halteromyces radiatus]|uniref:WD40-repeat-containing domain protein n=1 Tax=Halteromyces radiatus TaxID=101107 RepID=UPI00221F5FD2|nr:WD40-repeat-containing domain protein [Halteromyces radiatus]KAI8089880.1 WD40-repeat-containing domain protein [Halteromyces radiatus]
MVNLKQAPLVVYGHTARVWDCQIVGEYLVSISEDATCRVWKNAMMANDNKDSIDLGDTSMDCLACWEGHTGKNIWSAAVSPDHRIVATGGQDSGIRLWSLTSIKENNIVSEDDLACMRLPEQYKGDMIRNFGLINHKTLMASTDHGHLIRFDASTNIPGWSDVYQDDDLRGYSILQQSSCGRLLVAGSMNGGLLFYSTQDEFKSLKLDIHSQKIFEIFIIASQVNKDLFYIVSYGYNGDIYFHLLDTSDPTKTTVSTPYMLKLPECRTTLVSAALVESKGVLICGSRESTMLIYRLPDFTIDHFHHNNKLPVHPAIQVDKVHGKQCISGITIKQSSSSSMISPFTEEDCITFWTTGRDGCYIEYRLKTANARNSSFSPDQQEAISVNQDLILEKVYRNKVTKGWLEGAVYVDDELLLLGFYRKSFFVYNETKHFEMISVACGGAHRRWHFNTLDARLNHASFAFIRKEAIYAYIRDGSNSTNGFQEITLQSNFHGREVRAMKYLKLPANSGDHSNQPIVFATGGEDTILRIHQYIPKESKFVTHSTIRKHKSVIKCIEWSHGNETLLFTAGGTEEFRCWKLEMYQDHENSLVVNCLEWAVCPVVSDERIETRIMDLTTIVIDSSRGLHLVGAVYSDAMIRIWLFNEKTRQFSLIVDGTWHAKCILQITHLVLAQENEKNRILFFTSATDGKVAIWDISEELYSVLENVEQVEMDPTKPAIKLSQPLGFYLVHMSGVNALEVMDFDKDHILILTGGEDNSVAATLVNKRNWKMVDDGPCNVPNAHASSITGIYLIDHMDTQKRAMATVSTDQRLNIWMIESIDKGSLAVNLVDTVFVDIPDPSALDGIRLDGQLHFTSTGIGLQSFKFIHDHL